MRLVDAEPAKFVQVAHGDLQNANFRFQGTLRGAQRGRGRGYNNSMLRGYAARVNLLLFSCATRNAILEFRQENAEAFTLESAPFTERGGTGKFLASPLRGWQRVNFPPSASKCFSRNYYFGGYFLNIFTTEFFTCFSSPLWEFETLSTVACPRQTSWL